MKITENEKYREIECKTALNKLKRKIPYGWDLNIYRNCKHGCKYCYAIYTNEFLEEGKYTESVYVKTNIVEALEKELSSKKWKREVINIGGATDSYQPVEAKYKLMPEILKLLIKYKIPAIISTKSDLVLRDYDLIDELSRITYINIAATITTKDEKIRKEIEPFGSKSTERFKMLKEFRKTNASIGLHVMPIIPFLTDTRENFEWLYSNAKKVDVHYVLPGTLYLRGKTRTVYFDFIKTKFPHLYNDLSMLYKTGGADKEYKNRLYEMVNSVKEKYSLSGSYTKPMREKMNQ